VEEYGVSFDPDCARDFVTASEWCEAALRECRKSSFLAASALLRSASSSRPTNDLVYEVACRIVENFTGDLLAIDVANNATVPFASNVLPKVLGTRTAATAHDAATKLLRHFGDNAVVSAVCAQLPVRFDEWDLADFDFFKPFFITNLGFDPSAAGVVDDAELDRMLAHLKLERSSVLHEMRRDDTQVWPIMTTAQAATAIDRTVSTVKNWSKSRTNAIEKIDDGQYRVNPDFMLTKQREKWCGPNAAKNR